MDYNKIDYNKKDNNEEFIKMLNESELEYDMRGTCNSQKCGRVQARTY